MKYSTKNVTVKRDENLITSSYSVDMRQISIKLDSYGGVRVESSKNVSIFQQNCSDFYCRAIFIIYKLLELLLIFLSGCKRYEFSWCISKYMHMSAILNIPCDYVKRLLKSFMVCRRCLNFILKILLPTLLFHADFIVCFIGINL